MVNFDQTKKYTACFVNDNEPPARKIPQNVYRYSKDYGEKTYSESFYRLYLYVYEYDVPNSDFKVEYSLYSWEEVKVKREYVASMVQLIDCQKGLELFLEEEV